MKTRDIFHVFGSDPSNHHQLSFHCTGFSVYKHLPVCFLDVMKPRYLINKLKYNIK